MSEFKTPPGPIHRLGRYPDPWTPPDWSHAQADGTFGNRFDDPNGQYRVLYASSQRLGCFLETLARFRPDLTLVAELRQIEGDDDFFPLGQVPRMWCEGRVLGSGGTLGRYADICSAQWVAHLRRQLAVECLRLGLGDLDASALQRAEPRRLTQLVSREIYEHDLNGIYYRSRHGHELDNWALFEPFDLQITGEPEAVRADDPDLLNACVIFGLIIES